MTMTPGTQVRAIAEAAKHRARLLPPARYRHPGDVIRLITAGLVLAGALAVTITTHATYAGASAAAVTALAPAALAGRVLAGLVLAVLVTAAAAAVVVTLRYRRFRLLASLAGAAVLASVVVTGFIHLAGGQQPRDLAAGAGQWPWLTGASLAGPALLAAAVAVTVAAAPWLSRPWRRAAWITLWLAAVVRLITGTASPAEAVVAFAAGVTAGAAVLVLFGVPDRRIGPEGIAAALGSAGLPVTSVEPAGVEAKGSRPFVAAAGDGKPLFIKVLGSDQRDADLLYRAYRFIRLREVGDTRPAASLIQAVEHQALAAVMAERAGVAVPAVRQVIKTADGSALLAMDRVDGSALDQIPAQRLSDTMPRELWEQVNRLHRARIAHRSLRAANIVADRTGHPWVVDFSFSELGATPRQMALDVAELLASLAAIIGADRAVAAAAAVIGPDRVAAAVPLLQPLALSAGTRRAVAGHDGLLTQTRQAAAAASGRTDTELARLQRVRPRTLLVRLLPNLGPRELVDPALMNGLLQLVPEYAGSALQFTSLGRLSATSDAAAANRALARSVAGRGLVAARPAPAQDANAIVVTAATAARYGLRSIANLARAAPRLVFGGPPECPERAYCLPGLQRAYGLRFKAFIPLDTGGPLTLQALEAGNIDVALLFTTDPAIPARHLVILADDRGLQPAENITPLVRQDVIVRYGPHLVALLNRISALLDTGTLRALDAQVELDGHGPRSVARSWLRAHQLIPEGSAVH